MELPATKILDWIEQVAAGTLSVADFGALYYDFWLEQVPEGALSLAEDSFFGDVHEKLDYVTAEPDAEHRRYGYLTPAQYRTWLRRELALFKKQHPTA